MIKITGYSDDAILIEGMGFKQQFDCYESGDVVRFLAFSDGTLIRVTYGVNHEGKWRMTRIGQGFFKYSLEQATNETDNYSDVVTLTPLDGATPPMQWVTCSKLEPALPRVTC